MAHVLIVEARFYDHLNDMLVDGARAALKAADADDEGAAALEPCVAEPGKYSGPF